MASGSELAIKAPIRVVLSIRVVAEALLEPRFTEYSAQGSKFPREAFEGTSNRVPY
jgi:hypothetical protein